MGSSFSCEKCYNKHISIPNSKVWINNFAYFLANHHISGMYGCRIANNSPSSQLFIAMNFPEFELYVLGIT